MSESHLETVIIVTHTIQSSEKVNLTKMAAPFTRLTQFNMAAMFLNRFWLDRPILTRKAGSHCPIRSQEAGEGGVAFSDCGWLKKQLCYYTHAQSDMDRERNVIIIIKFVLFYFQIPAKVDEYFCNVWFKWLFNEYFVYISETFNRCFFICRQKGALELIFLLIFFTRFIF